MDQATLEEILANKEARAHQQELLRLRHGWPILSFCINMPGALKQNKSSIAIFEALLEALHVKISQNGWLVEDETIKYSNTGPEMIAAINSDAILLKKLTYEIETTHPLGRFGDMDVIATDGNVISRKSLGYKPRKCYICENDAKLCARSQAHSIDELIHFIDANVSKYIYESRS
jgi:holo-ACP synthase